jgi:hypothetical protein
MRRAEPHELTDQAVPVITARVTEAELAKWVPIDLDAIDDPLQAPEPSLGALAKLDAGGYVVLNYGKDPEQLTIELPANTKDASALLAAFFREVQLPLSRVLWHRKGTRLPPMRERAKRSALRAGLPQKRK